MIAPQEARHWQVTPDQYHADGTAVSRSMFMDFLEDRELYYGKWVSPKPLYPREEQKSEYDIGNAFEEMIQKGGPEKTRLIPREVLAEDGSKRGNAWKQFAAEHPGCVLLKEAEYKTVALMVAACMRNPKAKAILADLEGSNQFPIRWRDAEYGFDRKALLDRLIVPKGAGEFGCIGDIKTTVSLRQHKLAKSIEQFGYDYQNVWYQEGVSEYLHEELPFVFLFVKKSPPFRCRTVQLEPEYLHAVEKAMHEKLRELAECYASGNWSEDDKTLWIPKPRWR